MNNNLEQKFIDAFSHVHSSTDIAPEHPKGEFNISTDGIQHLADEIQVRYMDYGTEITIQFTKTNDEFLPTQAVKEEELYETKKQNTEKIQVEEKRNIDTTNTKQGYTKSIIINNTTRSTDYDVYPGDTIRIEPIAMDRYYGWFTGCHQEDIKLLDTVDVSPDRLTEDVTETSAVTVMKELEVIDTVLEIIDWMQSFSANTLEWEQKYYELSQLEARTYQDITQIRCTL